MSPEEKRNALEMLKDLKSLLAGWGIQPDDWYLTGELAMLLKDYPVDYRPGQIDVLLCRSVWPWDRAEEQVSLFPDKGTQADEELRAFTEKHGIFPDFHPLPHVGLNAEDRFEHTAWHPDKDGVRVLQPWAAIFQRGRIVEYYAHAHPRGLEVFDQAKYRRWKNFVSQAQQRAEEIGDKKTMDMCQQVVPIIQRAIDHFDQPSVVADESAEGRIVRGQSVYPGKVRGQAQHWQDGADFKGKIAVLNHLLPAQVSLIKEAAGIVTDQGGLLSHAATIAREYQIPTVIGTQNATQALRDGEEVELDAEAGTVTKV